MRKLLYAAVLSGATTLSGAAQADGDCAAVFETLKAKYPFDLSQCVAGEPAYTLQGCPKPDNFVPDMLPTTHVILALDASGSMAGQIGGRAKMDIAKSEAQAFLTSLHPSTKVSLVVYGHKGDNTEQQKPASCASAETIHDFRSPRGRMQQSVAALRPVGWTPLGGVLGFIRDEVEKLPKETLGSATAPVVYLISDGEETCGGDPVAEARTLAGLGTRTVVNTIGFDADEETRQQLEAIADAGAGRFYPAENAKALRDRLNEIADAEGRIHRFNYCVNINTGRIAGAWQKVSREVLRCYRDNDPNTFRSRVAREISKADPDSDIGQCARELRKATRELADRHRGWVQENIVPLTTQAVEAANAYKKEMGLIVIEQK